MRKTINNFSSHFKNNLVVFYLLGVFFNLLGVFLINMASFLFYLKFNLISLGLIYLPRVPLIYIAFHEIGFIYTKTKKITASLSNFTEESQFIFTWNFIFH